MSRGHFDQQPQQIFGNTWCSEARWLDCAWGHQFWVILESVSISVSDSNAHLKLKKVKCVRRASLVQAQAHLSFKKIPFLAGAVSSGIKKDLALVATPIEYG